MTDERGSWHRAHAATRRGRSAAFPRPLLYLMLYLMLCLMPLLLSACMGPDIDAVRELRPDTGDDFTQTLAEDYRRIALFEADEMYDWIDAGHFAVKGLQAGAGIAVEPEPMADWDLPRAAVPQLQEARRRLLTALQERTADAEAARVAARAQTDFDCWVEQQEENHQPDDIAACRDGFYSDLSELGAILESRAEAVTTPVALPEPPSGVTSREGAPVAVALFAFDSAGLDGAARVAVRAAADQAARQPEAALVVVGHTDRKGSDAYNLALSLRRAEAVRNALIAQGVAADRIDLVARGEWDPAVPTADEVAEPANRRVELFVLPDGGSPPLSSQQTEMPVGPAGADGLDGGPRPLPACFDPAPARPGLEGPQWPEAQPGDRPSPGPCAPRAPYRPLQPQSRRDEGPAGFRTPVAEAPGEAARLEPAWVLMSFRKTPRY